MRIRAILPLALAILAAGLALAAATHTLDELVRAVRDAVERHESDGALARVLHRVELDRRLDNHTAEELESQAPGPMSIAELERLREATRDKPLPTVLPKFASPPEPTPDEQRGVLEAARDKALAYTAGLPDFICTETIRRFELPAGKRGWKLNDTLAVELTYFGGHENYRLTARNGRAPVLTYEQEGGPWSKGEFGSMLLDVFSPATRTEFKWSHWTTLRKRPTCVFSFRIDVGNSRYRLVFDRADWRPAFVTVGEHGLVYIDRQTREVMGLESEADSIPEGFPIAGATRTLDYGPAEVGGRDFLLPRHGELRLVVRDSRLVQRNAMDFSSYHKFTGESSISFGDVEVEKR